MRVLWRAAGSDVSGAHVCVCFCEAAIFHAAAPTRAEEFKHAWMSRKKETSGAWSLCVRLLQPPLPLSMPSIQEFLFGKDYSEGLLHYSDSPESLYKYRRRADLCFKQPKYALPLCATEEDLFTVQFLHLF